MMKKDKINKITTLATSILITSTIISGCSSNTGNTIREQSPETPKVELVDNGVPVAERERAMRILLTNDDGHDSIGIQMLHDELEKKGYDVWTVAPIYNQSGAGTSILWNKEEHKLEEVGNQRYAFEGTPTDTFKAAVNVIMEEKPDLVISGVNDGPNFGEVQMNSGTVGIAARAIRHGYPSIAASLTYFGGDGLEDYMKSAVDYVVGMVDVFNENWKSGEMIMPLGTGISINYPAKDSSEIKGIEFVANEEIYTDFQNYRYDEEKKGIYNFNDMDLLNAQVEDESVKTDLALAMRGYITLSVIDGNWNAAEEKVDFMKDTLKDLVLPEK